MEERIIINDYIENDPLSEENLDKTLNFLHEIRLLLPNKTIWLYTGFTWEEIWENNSDDYKKRQQIVSLCDVLIDGHYKEDKRDITLQWRGSSNQRVIDIKKSLEQNKIFLYCE